MEIARSTLSGTGCSLGRLAEELGGLAQGPADLWITAVSGLEDAAPGSLVRAESDRYLAKAEATPASALLVPEGPMQVTKPCIRVARVKQAFIRCLELFTPPDSIESGVHPTAVLGAGAELGTGCSVGPHAVIAEGARVGARTVIGANAVLGEGCELGCDCRIHAGAILYPRTSLGDRVIVHSGTVLGADGFGYEWNGARHQKVPQIGRVRVMDDVEIGANVCIDRATTGETVIGPGTKIDNLVQIAHNVRFGAHCLVISQVGVAGSTRIGNGVVLAGQAGLPDHVTIGDGAVVAAKAGVWGDLAPGAKVAGHPARPHREELRIQRALGRLPDLLKRFAELEERLAALESAESDG